MRLDKFICKSTQLTKSQAQDVIMSARVSVNGVVNDVLNDQQINAATQVHENNCVMLDGEVLTPRPFRYILMHKPQETICSNTDGDYPSLFNLLDLDEVDQLHIAGRLDVDTTGLVLITDNGRWTFNITRPDKQCPKVYLAKLSYSIESSQVESLINRFQHGIALQGESALTLPALLDVIPPQAASTDTVRLTIIEGKYHQVKRMFAAIGNRVKALHREKIGPIQLDVAEGEWRYLTKEEVAAFS